MTKFTYLIIALLIYTSILQAQSNSISITDKWGSQIFISDGNGRAFENKYAEMTGTPYFIPNFKQSDIILKDGRKYKNIPARINLLEQELNFISSNGEEGYIGKGLVSEIVVYDTLKSVPRLSRFISGVPAIDQQNSISFYQVLVTGNCSLLKSISKNIEERSNELSGERSKEFATRENMYVFKQGVIKRLKKDNSLFSDFFQDKIDAVNKYYKDENLNIKNEAHLIQLMNYYNSLK